MLAENPLGNSRPVGGRFFDLILLGYGLPAVLAVTQRRTAAARPRWASRLSAAVTSEPRERAPRAYFRKPENFFWKRETRPPRSINCW